MYEADSRAHARMQDSHIYRRSGIAPCPEGRDAKIADEANDGNESTAEQTQSFSSEITNEGSIRI